MTDDDVRAALMRHWAASDANQFEDEHRIYAEDAVLDYPQSNERLRGRRAIQASRRAQPDAKRFAVRRVLGAGGLWVSELLVHYGDKAFHVVSVMELEDGLVVHETQYFGEPFAPGASRARWVEPIA